MQVIQNKNAVRRWLRSACFAILCIFSSTLLAVVAAEVILRIFGYSGAPEMLLLENFRLVDDPILDWRHLPNSEARYRGVLYRYNSAGFRDMEHAIEKSPGITRIMILGDSVSEGLGLPWENVFAPILQARLGSQSEVINFGTRALNSPQEVHLFEQEGLKYAPDLVVINFVLNDCDFYSSAKEHQTSVKNQTRILLLNIPISRELKAFLKSWAFIYLFHQRAYELKNRVMGMHETSYYSSLWESQLCRTRIAESFDRLASLQGKYHFNVAVLIWPFITDYDRYEFRFVHEWVEKQATLRGFSALDLFQTFARVPYRSLQIDASDNIHANVLGHQLAVDSFVRWYFLPTPTT